MTKDVMGRPPRTQDLDLSSQDSVSNMPSENLETRPMEPSDQRTAGITSLTRRAVSPLIGILSFIGI